MKIKKTLFSTEIEIKPGELRDFEIQDGITKKMALLVWIEENFGIPCIGGR